jgi:hypothetical protein
MDFLGGTPAKTDDAVDARPINGLARGVDVLPSGDE